MILGDLIHNVGGRLTLTTAVPVTTADVSAAATLYYTPFIGNAVPLYDTAAAVWTYLEFAEISLSLAALSANTNYDIFCYNNAGTLTLEAVAWSTATARATALATQDGRYVKSGDASRLYLGTIRINSSGGQCEDTLTQRYVWNYYNRVLRTLRKSDSTSHGYTTATWRSWNNDATLRVELVLGLIEDVVTLECTAASLGTAGSNTTIAYDVTNAQLDGSLVIANVNSGQIKAGATFFHIPGIGYHFYQLVENGAAGATFAQAWANVMIRG